MERRSSFVAGYERTSRRLSRSVEARVRRSSSRFAKAKRPGYLYELIYEAQITSKKRRLTRRKVDATRQNCDIHKTESGRVICEPNFQVSASRALRIETSGRNFRTKLPQVPQGNNSTNISRIWTIFGSLRRARSALSNARCAICPTRKLVSPFPSSN